MPTSFYDVVVIGDELAGTVAAALLARRGFRVLMLSSTPVERDAVGPHQVPRAPLALTGLESPTLKRVVGELNLLQLLRRRVEPNRPGWQLLLSDHRLDVDEDLPRELARELPDEAAASLSWLARAREISATFEPLLAQDVTLPPDGFWDRRDLKRITAQLPPEGTAQALADPYTPLAPGPPRLLASLPALFASDLHRPGVTASARLADLHRRGTWRLDGGREALRQLLIERIRTYSGEVRHDVGARTLVIKRGRAIGVGIGDRDETVGCAQVIAGLAARDLVDLLPERPPRRLADAARLGVAFHRYRIHLVAPLEVFPDALGPLAFALRDPAAPEADGNALAIHLTPGHDRHATLTAEALATDPSPAGLDRVRRATLAHLDAIFPFLDRHLAALWSPHDGLPAEGASIHQPVVVPPIALDAIWDLPGARPLGLCGLPHASGIKGLYLASRQVLPGLGFEGELATGWGAARLITSRSQRREVDKTALLVGG
ncbi:MAG: hypothetical protein EXR72_07250 [Myxococcales bacterium]|nr:hypothetical protein [Myxococcales bacterium]